MNETDIARTMAWLIESGLRGTVETEICPPALCTMDPYLISASAKLVTF